MNEHTKAVLDAFDLIRITPAPLSPDTQKKQMVGRSNRDCITKTKINITQL